MPPRRRAGRAEDRLPAGPTSASGANIAHMHPFNIHDAQFTYDGTEPDGFISGEALELQKFGTALNVRLYEARPGQALCPYHYEYEEEWCW